MIDFRPAANGTPGKAGRTLCKDTKPAGLARNQHLASVSNRGLRVGWEKEAENAEHDTEQWSRLASNPSMARRTSSTSE